MTTPETPEAAVMTHLETAFAAMDPPVTVPVFTILPDDQKMPYVLCQPPHVSTRDRSAAQHAVDGKPRVVDEIQVDVFQHLVSEESGAGKRTRVFDAFLAELTAAALVRAKLNFAARVYGVDVDGPQRIPNPLSSNIVHQVVSVRLHRRLLAARPA